MATLYWSPNSPYVRKVMLALRETGQEATVTIKRGVTSPVLLQTEHDVWNPTGKVPTLVLNEKRPIFGSQAINQYIDIKAPAGKKLLPTDETRADELTLEALADGILDACLSVRYEISTRPEEFRWQKWVDGQTSKITRGLPLLYQRIDPASGVYQLTDPIADVLSLGSIAIACTCWYLDKRFPDIDWRAGEGQKLAAWYLKVQDRKSWNNGEN